MRFTAEFGDRGVVVPGDPKTEFGGARAPVAGTINGTPFRGRLMVYGGVTYLGFRKEIRDAAGGIEEGDAVEVVIERDDAPREVDRRGQTRRNTGPARQKSPADVARGGEAPIRYEGVTITSTNF
jgi:hypothetical protein